MRFLIVLLLLAPLLVAQEPSSSLRLMPWPASVKIDSGQLNIKNSFSVAIQGNDPRLHKTAEIFLNDLRRHTGSLPLDFSITNHAGEADLRIHSQHANKNVQELGEDESYKLEVSSSGAQLDAPTTLGVMRGLQTLLQLVEVTPQGFAVPAVTIEDQPRFAWRGLMIDSARHFMPVEVIKRNLDGMAAVKLNVFHWHLSDNQGFRVESHKLPKLQRQASDGLYYTQDEIRDVIGYAGDRGIRVVPEFDMPGHSTAWFAAYPELASGPGPYFVEREWGVLDAAMDPTRESTYKLLEKFIGEMAKLFPDTFFHIGGDEVNGKQWDANPKIQAFMRSHNLQNDADLQAYFNRRIQKIVAKHSKIMEGWDEILRPDLPKSIVIQSWRGQKSLADAARQGYRGLLSFGYYLDLMSSTASHYQVDPMSGDAASLTDEQKKNILGGEACMWSEYVSPETIDSRIWPRMAAIAERLWSPQSVTDVGSMYSRMAWISDWLDAYGLTQNTQYIPMLQRMAGTSDVSALRTLVDVVEPVKRYARGKLAQSPPSSLTPLNRVVDAARPESETARQFSELVDAFVTDTGKPGDEAQIRAELKRWRDNDAQFQELAKRSAIVEEVAPLSQFLSSASTATLQALDYLGRGEKAPKDWEERQLALLQQAFQPKGQVLLMVVPAMQELIQLSAGDAPTVLPLPKSASF